MSSDDEFDNIINNQEDAAEEEEDFETLWDALCFAWKKVHQSQGVLVRGIAILEYVDERGRILRWASSPDMAPWDMQGMLTSALTDIQAESFAGALDFSDDTDEDDEDDD